MKNEVMKDYVRKYREAFGNSGNTCKVLVSYEQGKINMDEAIEQIGTIFMSPETIKEILTGLNRNNVFVLERNNEST